MEETDPSGRYKIQPLRTSGNYVRCIATVIGRDKKYTARKINRQSLYLSSFFTNFRNEYEILSSLSHPLIQRLVEVSFDETVHYQIVEYEEYNMMIHYRDDFPLIESSARVIFWNLLEALSFLHSNHIAHLDVRPENVLIINGKFKLGGFLFAQRFEEDELITGVYGTPNFQAPEIFTEEKFDPVKADSWACGVFLLSLLLGKLPFEWAGKSDINAAADVIRQQVLMNIFKFPEFLSDDVVDLLKLILVNDPVKRPTIDRIKRHRWLQFPDKIPGVMPRASTTPEEC